MADPMTAATLLRILIGEGVTVRTPHSGWTTHERDSATGKPFGPVYGVMMHHTAGLGVYEYIYNGSTALPGPLAHAYIDKAGVVYMASAGRANHAGGGDPNVLNAVRTESYMTRPPAPQYHEGSPGAADGNDAFYGFECENKGDGLDPWPTAQYEAMIKAAAAICRFYQWSDKSAIGHLEWSNWKSDPRGIDMAKFRADLRACLAHPPGVWPDIPEEPVTMSQADREAIAETVLELDGIIPNKNPDTMADNPFMALKTAVTNLDLVLRDTRDKVEEILAKLNAA